MRLRWWEALLFALVALAVTLYLVFANGGNDAPEPDAPPPATTPGPDDPPPADPPPDDPPPDDPPPDDPPPDDPPPDDPPPDDPSPDDPPPEDPLRATLVATGDARAALARLAAAPADPAHGATRAGIRAALAYEVAGTDAAVPPDHPDAAALQAARARAQTQRAGFEAAAAQARPLATVLSDLAIQGSDAPAEVWVHGFFRPPERPIVSDPAALPPAIDAAASLVMAQWGHHAPATRVALASALTRRYEAADRARGRLRWAALAAEAKPDDPKVRLAYVRALISQKALHEALALTGATPALDDPALVRQRAVLGGWLSLPAVEVAAWQALPPTALTAKERERLMSLLSWLGRAEEALPFVLDAARNATDDAPYDGAVELAMQAGKLELALGLMLEAAGKSKTPRVWRERFVTVALLDLRYPTAIQELERLVADFPEGRFERLPGTPRYAERLEELYRTREMDASLVAHYEKQLLRTEAGPDRRALRARLIDLHVLLGNRVRVKELLQDALGETRTVEEFLAIYPTARSFDVGEIEARAHALLEQGDDTAALRLRLYDTTQDRMDDQGRRAMLAILHGRHPAHPEIRARYLAVLDRMDPVAAAALEEARAQARPDDVAAVRAWVKRASWTEDRGMQLRASEALRRVAPDDIENLYRLGYLYGGAGRSDEAADVWRTLVAREGRTGDAATNLAETLLARKSFAEALPLLEARADAPGSAREARVRYAEALQAAGRKEEALTRWRRLADGPDGLLDDQMAHVDLLLDLERYDVARKRLHPLREAHPDDGHVLLRLAQAYAWDGMIESARPLLEARITFPREDATAVDRSDRTEAHFILGEIDWSLRRRNAARQAYRRVLARIARSEVPTRSERLMRAKVRGRLGDVEASVRAYEALIEDQPDSADPRLDLADTLLAAKRVGPARRAVEEARRVEPEDRRVARMDAATAVKEHRYEHAARILRQLRGPGRASPALIADLGTAEREAGRYRSAAYAYADAIRSGAEARWVHRGLRDLRLTLGPRVTQRAAYRTAGDDEVWRIGAEGVFAPCGCDRITLALGIEHVSFRGARADVDRTVGDEFQIIAPELRWRFFRKHELRLGLESYVGRRQGPDVGARAGVTFTGIDPFWSLDVELRHDVLMEETGAAPALGGRKRGIAVEAYRELGDWWWVAAGASYDRISLRSPMGRRSTDGWATWRAELGNRLSESEPPFLTSRIVLSGSEHLDDRSLAQVVPLGKRFDFLTGILRMQKNWEQVVDATFEVYAGLDLRADSIVWGAEGRLRLDLARFFGLELRAGYGNQARFQDGSSTHVDLRIDWLF